MMAEKNNRSVIPLPGALRLVGVIGGIWALLVVLTATLAYRVERPDFSLFTTYLSDIGDTAGWPQILFNSGTLIAAPIRYLVVVLLVFRLQALGAGRVFAVAALLIGLLASIGTIVMTAIPSSVAPSIHEMGIPLYFVGVVVLQALIFSKEWSLPSVPRVLPVVSLLTAVVYVVFAALVMLYQRGLVTRNTPVIWEWLCFIVSVIWLFAHSILLSKSARQ